MSVHLRRDLRIVHHAIRVGYPVDMEKLERKLSSSKQDSVADRSDDRVRRHVMEAVSLQAARLLAGLCREQRGERGVHSMELCQSGEAGNSRAPLGIVAARRLSVGQVLGFYPGCIFPADEDPPRSDKLFANEYEGVYIDGQNWFPLEWRGRPEVKQQHGAIWHGNRLAVGNLLNHPPKTRLPNCVPIPFRWSTWQDLGEATPAAWGRLLPHVVLRAGKVVRTASGDRTEGSDVTFPPWPHLGMAFVAVRPVEEGDELFWNYRLTPRATAAEATFPSWYAPVDEDAFESAVLGVSSSGQSAQRV